MNDDFILPEGWGEEPDSEESPWAQSDTPQNDKIVSNEAPADRKKREISRKRNSVSSQSRGLDEEPNSEESPWTQSDISQNDIIASDTAPANERKTEISKKRLSASSETKEAALKRQETDENKTILSQIRDFYVEDAEEKTIRRTEPNVMLLYVVIMILALVIVAGCISAILFLKNKQDVPNSLNDDESQQNNVLLLETSEATSEVDDATEVIDKSDVDDDKLFAEEVVDAVIKNESMWLYSEDEGTDGYTECWFQDLDMDGVPEFIVGGQVVGVHGGVFFDVYRYQDGELVYMSVQSIENGTVWYTKLGIWGTGSRGGHNGFVCQLYQDTRTNSYVYVYPSSDGVADYTDYSVYELGLDSNNTLITKEIVTVEWTMDGYLYQPEYIYNETISTLTRQELLDRYDNYFKSLTPYRTSVKAIPCTGLSAGMSGHYDVMSNDAKKTALLESYEAWGYEKSAVIERPFADLISEIRNIKDVVVPTNLYYIGIGTPYSDDGFLNLRSSPEITDNIIVQIPNDSIILVYDCGKSDWYYVEYNSYKGYVKKDYVITEMDRQENTTEVPMATIPFETRRTETVTEPKPETEYKEPPTDPPVTVPPTPTEPSVTVPENPPPPVPEMPEY